MTTQRIEIRTPVLVLPTLRLRRISAVLVLQLSARDAVVRGARSAHGAAVRERALAAATARFEQDRAAVQRTALRAL